MFQNTLLNNNNNNSFIFFNYLKARYDAKEVGLSSPLKKLDLKGQLLSLEEEALQVRRRAQQNLMQFLMNIQNIQVCTTIEGIESAAKDISRQSFRLCYTDASKRINLLRINQNDVVENKVTEVTLSTHSGIKCTNYKDVVYLQNDLFNNLYLDGSLVNFIWKNSNQAGLTQWLGFFHAAINAQPLLENKAAITNFAPYIEIINPTPNSLIQPERSKSAIIRVTLKIPITMLDTGNQLTLPPLTYQYMLENTGSHEPNIQIKNALAFFTFTSSDNPPAVFYLTQENQQKTWMKHLRDYLKYTPYSADEKDIYLFAFSMFTDIWANLSNFGNTVFKVNSQYQLRRNNNNNNNQ